MIQGMFDDYELSYLFPQTALDVTIYVNYLQDVYRKDARNKAAGPRLNSLQIQEIIWYKGKMASQHECIVAVVKLPDQSESRYLRLDRYASIISENGKRPEREQSGFFSSRSLNSASSSSLEMLGKDCIQAIQKLPPKDSYNRIAEFSPLSSKSDNSVHNTSLSTLCLWDLAILAVTIHQHALRYEALKTQCYWYASSLVTVVKKKYDYSEEITKKPPKRAGTWHSIPINTADGDKDMESICAKFSHNVNMFKMGAWRAQLSGGLSNPKGFPDRESARPSN